MKVLNHAVGAHYLSILRNQETDPGSFERACHILSTILILEATKGLPVSSGMIETPVAKCKSASITKQLVIVPVLRAGVGMVSALKEIWPDAKIGYIGLERNDVTSESRCYYQNIPDLSNAAVFLLDPMLATGGSACHAIDILKQNHANEIQFISIVATQVGITKVEEHHPDVSIFTASIDKRLTSKNYIDPGLGDFGDRICGL